AKQGPLCGGHALMKATKLWTALALLLAAVWATDARADLQEYLKKAEPAYTWKLRDKIAHPDGTIYDIHLVSQTWHDITWEHQLQIYQPRNVEPTKTMLLWNTGGSPNPRDVFLGMELAKKSKSPVAFLFNNPNQPLFDGKKEDALIAETFVRYLRTEDDTWPLLLPMVKSVVKGMDTVQEFSKAEWQQPVEAFL